MKIKVEFKNSSVEISDERLSSGEGSTYHERIKEFLCMAIDRLKELEGKP